MARPGGRLDTEGQYEFVARTVGDALCSLGDMDDFAKNKKKFTKLGFVCTAKTFDDIYNGAVEGRDERPNDVRNQIYESNLAGPTKKAKGKATKK